MPCRRHRSGATRPSDASSPIGEARSPSSEQVRSAESSSLRHVREIHDASKLRSTFHRQEPLLGVRTDSRSFATGARTATHVVCVVPMGRSQIQATCLSTEAVRNGNVSPVDFCSLSTNDPRALLRTDRPPMSRFTRHRSRLAPRLNLPKDGDDTRSERRSRLCESVQAPDVAEARPREQSKFSWFTSRPRPRVRRYPRRKPTTGGAGCLPPRATPESRRMKCRNTPFGATFFTRSPVCP